MNPRCSRCPATKNDARVTLCVTVTDEVTHGVTYTIAQSRPPHGSANCAPLWPYPLLYM
jgi:hypothetical protein